MSDLPDERRRGPTGGPNRGPNRGLFGGMFGGGQAAPAVADAAWLEAMLEVEAALAGAQAGAGIIPVPVAETIVRACHPGSFDIDALGRAATESAGPVPALVDALRERLTGAAAGAVHKGATSQDILDTAAMLVTGRALRAILTDLSAVAGACARLARRHRDTVMAGRTLLQQAVPTTFGLKAANWLASVDSARGGLAEIRANRLAVQLGGAAGTLSALGDDGVGVAGRLAADLGLAEPVLPWHTDRTRIGEIASGLGIACGVLGKIAADVVLLAQTEVGEVSEAGSGGSSAMPHKHNPVAAIVAVAAAKRAPGLVATLLAAMPQEHERAAGAWQAEWEPLGELLRITGSAADRVRASLEGLVVDAGRMRANLALTGGLPMAEHVVEVLGGGPAQRAAVAAACAKAAAEGRPLREVLLNDTALGLTPGQVDESLDPQGYLGSAGAFVDRALAAHRERS